MYRFKRFTDKANTALNLAVEAARELGHTYIGTEHLLLGLLREGSGVAATALAARGITVLRYVEKMLATEASGLYSALTPDDFTPRAKAAMEAALTDAALAGQRLAGTEHILSAILRDDTGVAVRLLRELDGRPQELLSDLARAQEPNPVDARGGGKGRTPSLEQFGRDLTALARDGRLDPVVGREKEIQRVLQILCRRTKNNPCLVGEPGVGKTAVVEGLAQRMADGEVPDALMNMRLVTLDLTGMVAGTKYRGDFEERVKNALAEVRRAGDVLLFIDELHNLIGTGAAEGAVDAANIFKPLLARGELKLVGATTIAEYRRHIERDAALERRFQPVTVNEPTAAETREILTGLRPRYEAHHGVRITDAALDAAITLSQRYIPDRFLPDKAVDLMDEAAAHRRLLPVQPPSAAVQRQQELQRLAQEKKQAVSRQAFELAARLHERERALQAADTAETAAPRHGEVTGEEVAAIVAGWTGIPVTQISGAERDRLRELEAVLHRRIVGQREAVQAVARAVRRSRVGLADPQRPAGSFIFLGPTGVGKTALCKALAEAVFGDEKAMIRLDMSEYMEKHAVARMVGSPPGYVGHEQGGQLTEQVRSHPYTVLLFDEIEKAHPDVFNMLLQILEDGRLTDAQGRQVDFTHTLVVMTSNVGAREVAGQGKVGFGASDTQADAAAVRAAAMAELKRLFRPEFINRVDEIVVFLPLTHTQLREIAARMLTQTVARLEAQGYGCVLDDGVAAQLAESGFDPVYGARPIRRAVQRQVEDVIAEGVLRGAYCPGDTVRVAVRDGCIVCERDKATEPAGG